METDAKWLQAKEEELMMKLIKREELMKKKQEIRNHLTHLKKERRDLRTAVEAAAGKTHRLLLKKCLLLNDKALLCFKIQSKSVYSCSKLKVII